MAILATIPGKPGLFCWFSKIHLKKLQNLLCPVWSEICQVQAGPCCFCCCQANAAVRKNPNTYFQLFPCQRQRWGRHGDTTATGEGRRLLLLWILMLQFGCFGVPSPDSPGVSWYRWNGRRQSPDQAYGTGLWKFRMQDIFGQRNKSQHAIFLAFLHGKQLDIMISRDFQFKNKFCYKNTLILWV